MIARVGLVQLDAGDDVRRNTERALALAGQALDAGARLVALPETFLYRGRTAGYRAAVTTVSGSLVEPFAALARERAAWLLLGSVAEASGDPDRPYITSVLLAPNGSVATTYRKIHLFDVSIDAGPAARESARARPGDRAVVADIPLADLEPRPIPDPEPGSLRLGLSICYDLRFPELYRALALAGAQVLCVPSDFTERTGRDHWEPLLRARAIENGAYVIAPAQCGMPPAGNPAYGHSLVVDPWGIVVAQAPDGPGVVLAGLDPDRVAAARRQIPVLDNRRPDTYCRA
ncbi:MAG: carbon-nitrogen hydrolase family protein [Candidatus Limnocylindrales bacterium]